jgi:hypothetical protein
LSGLVENAKRFFAFWVPQHSPTLKHSLHNQLGEDLKFARKAKPFTQAELAANSGLSVPAIRLMERGHGNVCTRSICAAWGS